LATRNLAVRAISSLSPSALAEVTSTAPPKKRPKTMPQTWLARRGRDRLDICILPYRLILTSLTANCGRSGQMLKPKLLIATIKLSRGSDKDCVNRIGQFNYELALSRFTGYQLLLFLFLGGLLSVAKKM